MQRRVDPIFAFSVFKRRRAVALLIACALLAAAGGCSEFVDDDLPGDAPRRPKLAATTQTQDVQGKNPATAFARSEADQKTLDAALQILKESKSDKEAAEAALTVARFADPRGAEPILNLVREGRVTPAKMSSDTLAPALAEALRRINSDAAREQLELILRGESSMSPAMEGARLVLIGLRDPKTVPLLMELARGTTWKKNVAIGMLGALELPAATQGLQAIALESVDDDAAFCAAVACIGGKSSATAEALMSLWRAAKNDTQRAAVISAMGTLAMPEFAAIGLEAMAGGSKNIRQLAARLTATQDTAASWAALDKMMRSDPDQQTRNAAMMAMFAGVVSRSHERQIALVAAGAIGDEASSTEFKINAIRWCRYHIDAAPRAIVAAIARALSDADPQVRREAANCLALGNAGMAPATGDAVQLAAALQKGLDDKDPQVSDAAARALLSFGETKIVSAYVERELKAGSQESDHAEKLAQIKAALHGPRRDSARRLVDSAGVLLEGPVK